MKPSLQLKQSQSITLTPQLQQSIRLLQMSTLELTQEIDQALIENPLLERSDDPLDDAVRMSASGSLHTDDSVGGPNETEERAEAPPPAEASDSNLPNGPDQGYTGEWQGSGGGSRGENPDDDMDYPQLGTSEPSLREHLHEQLASTNASEVDRILLELLIDELSPDGYLTCSMEEFAELLPEQLELEQDDLVSVLRLLQSFDPPGVGARDLRECLLIQLDLLEPNQSDEETTTSVRLAKKIVDAHLEILGARDFAKMRRLLKCDDSELKNAQEVIVGLSPRPGANFSGDEPTYVIPDVVVKRIGENWAVSLNPNVMPKLRVNDVYADALKNNKGGSNDLNGLLQEARWLIKNIQQRFDTILRVSEAIVERQKAFFSHGEVGMRPLVLREIADKLELHESTISRVTTNKYMLTPHGTFELKYFFGSHVATDSGGAASSTAIRALIKQVISAEDSKKPLSDNRIASLLAEQGFVVARRTVAKYREALRIPPVSQRKTL